MLLLEWAKSRRSGERVCVIHGTRAEEGKREREEEEY